VRDRDSPYKGADSYHHRWKREIHLIREQIDSCHYNKERDSPYKEADSCHYNKEDPPYKEIDSYHYNKGRD
jgi:hypothetical protein